MEVVVTKSSDTEIKLNPSFVLSVAHSPNSDQVSPFEYSFWENLPSVVLVEIYKLLPNRDKFNVALTCKAWGRIFSLPEVWRHAVYDFHFNGVDDCRSLSIPETLASGMRHLVIHCQYSEKFIMYTKGHSTRHLNAFLKTLAIYKPCHLVTLKIIITGNQFYNWISKLNLSALRKLIVLQTRLKCFDLDMADLEREDAIDLLQTIATRCGSTITDLSIGGLFRFRKDFPPGMELLWKSFITLTDLTIDNHHLSDHLLNTLSHSGSLSRLTVVSHKYYYSAIHSSSEAWEELTMARPNLEARFCFSKYTSLRHYMCNSMPPGVPLVSWEFHWSGLENWIRIYQHINTYFQNSLRSIAIEVDGQLEWEDSFLENIVERCLYLEKISFTVSPDVKPSKEDLIKSVQKYLEHQPASRLRRIKMNGEEIEVSSTQSQP